MKELDIINENDANYAMHRTNLDQKKALQEERALLNDGRRGEAYRRHIHNIVCIALYIVGLIIICMILIRAFHFLAPEKWHWLNAEENQQIERIIFGSVIFSLAGRYFKKFNIID
ncbi:hypothetical protein COR50_20885 [Chitinophaga caeni]|uniref:Uncharacterized protein n=1 Tax=Chitinophaga caeni TaxID=2029983 RepID=A0A291R012_9BACT|nr:hypothetical protein COR50_20885 [Chitinophaga caeni]